MEKKKSSIGKFIKIIFILLAIILIGLILIRMRTDNFQDTLSENQINWRVPQLPEGFNWIENNANEEDLKNNRIIFDGRFLNEAPEKAVSGEILASGKIYSVSLSDKDISYNGSGFSIDNILRGILESTGWSSSTRYGGYLFSGIAASGVQGNVSGYVKIEHSLIRTFVYSYRYDGNWVSSGNQPVHLECPCTVAMTLFISDPVALEDYIPSK